MITTACAPAASPDAPPELPLSLAASRRAHDDIAVIKSDAAAKELMQPRGHRTQPSTADEAERRQLAQPAHIGHRRQRPAVIEMKLLQAEQQAEAVG